MMFFTFLDSLQFIIRMCKINNVKPDYQVLKFAWTHARCCEELHKLNRIKTK